MATMARNSTLATYYGSKSRKPNDASNRSSLIVRKSSHSNSNSNSNSNGEQTITSVANVSSSHHLILATCALLSILIHPAASQLNSGQPMPPIMVPPPPQRMGPPPAPLPPPPPPGGRLAMPQQDVVVPGSGVLLRDADRVDRIIYPSDLYVMPNQSFDLGEMSYVIDHKRFVESVASRCFVSTILEDPDSVEPSFILIKPNSEIRLNATAPIELVRMAGFEPDKPTTIFIHGFTQSYPHTDWLRKVRSLYETNSLVHKQNLIFMDWGVASHGSYSQVAAMVSGMGSFLANFLMKLIDLGADRASIHLVGHSLGAHLAGFAGKRIRPRIGRITALDPAGPCFGKLFSNSPTDRLSPDDAYEVDVYHYDDSFLGLPGQIGQFDVYVNGGSSQPGTKGNMNTMLNAVVTMMFNRNRVLSESHTRSTEVHTAQLSVTGCQQVAYECRDWPAFTAGECGRCDDSNSQCFFMGFTFQYQQGQLALPEQPVPLRSSYPGKKFYIATTGVDSFCLHHHQILVKFEPSSMQEGGSGGGGNKRTRWQIQLELINQRSERLNVVVTNQVAPNVYSYLLLSEQAPSKIRAALLQVRQPDGQTIVPLRQERPRASHQASIQGAPFKVTNVEINYMSNVSPMIRRSLSSRLCPTGLLVPAQTTDSSSSSSSLEEWLALDDCS